MGRFTLGIWVKNGRATQGIWVKGRVTLGILVEGNTGYTGRGLVDRVYTGYMGGRWGGKNLHWVHHAEGWWGGFRQRVEGALSGLRNNKVY